MSSLRRIVRLDLNVSCIQNNPTMFSKPTPLFCCPTQSRVINPWLCKPRHFLIQGHLHVSSTRSWVQQHNLTLVEKATLVVVKEINGWTLSSGPIMHETKALTIIIGSQNSKVVFNVISSPTNPIIIGLSWRNHGRNLSSGLVTQAMASKKDTYKEIKKWNIMGFLNLDTHKLRERALWRSLNLDTHRFKERKSIS